MKVRMGLTCALLLGAILSSWSDDWPQFRGANGLGLAAPIQLPEVLSEETALWQVTTKGPGHSSPIIQGQRLFYTVTPTGKDRTRELVCLSTLTGEELWRKTYEFNDYQRHNLNSASSTSPTADRERVYLWWNNGDQSEVMALDHDGKPVWKTPLGKFESNYGCGSSVALAGDMLLVQKINLSDESFIAGLQAASGKIAWKTEIKEKIKTPYGTPIVRAFDGAREALFVSTEGGVFSLDTASGKFRWKWDAQFDHRCVASPVVAGDYLFASCGGGGGGKDSIVLHAPPGTQTVEERYRLSKQLPYVPTGLGIDGRFYFVNDGGVATCYEAASGKQLWRERLLSKCFASPIALGEHIYAFGRDGDYKVYRAAEAFELISEGELPAGIHTTPSVGDGKLFVRTDEKIYCFTKAPKA